MERINCIVSDDAKKVLLGYMKMNDLNSQDTALDKLLLNIDKDVSEHE